MSADAYLALAAAPGAVVLEGLHALKHALRFGADVGLAVTPDRAAVLALAAELAPDLVPRLDALLVPVGAAAFSALARRPPPSPVLALARRRAVDVAAVLARAAPGDPAPVVLLDDPRHAGNAGAVVRVAAAAAARAVLTTGDLDPWSAPVVRAAAGLHFAVDVAGLGAPGAGAADLSGRPLVALDPAGAPLRDAGALPDGALLAFGSERRGLSAGLRERADAVLALPMAAGVSSLNLAASVAAVLYSWRMIHPLDPPVP